jgi:hypothetical protein
MSLEDLQNVTRIYPGPTAEAYNPKSNQWRLISSMKISMDSSSENLVGLVYDPKQDEWVYMAHGLNTGDGTHTQAFHPEPLKEEFPGIQ